MRNEQGFEGDYIFFSRVLFFILFRIGDLHPLINIDVVRFLFFNSRDFSIYPDGEMSLNFNLKRQ